MLPNVGLECGHSQLPRLLPVILPIWRLAIDCIDSLISIKLTFDVLGENPLYADNDCHTVLTSLPSPAGRGSCGLVLAWRQYLGLFGCRQRALPDDDVTAGNNQSPASFRVFFRGSHSDQSSTRSVDVLLVTASGLARNRA